MIYQVNLEIESQTVQGDPTTHELTVPLGYVARIALLFPSGCAGLVHIQIYHNEMQVWPTTPGISFIGDGHLITFAERYDLPDPWNRLLIKGWNDDDSYSHTITVWISILPYETAWFLAPLTGLPRYLE